jgi:hypothetical protein
MHTGMLSWFRRRVVSSTATAERILKMSAGLPWDVDRELLPDYPDERRWLTLLERRLSSALGRSRCPALHTDNIIVKRLVGIGFGCLLLRDVTEQNRRRRS